MCRGRIRILQWCKTVIGILINTALCAKAIRRWKGDLVYSNTVTVPIGAFAARLLGLPHVWHLHEFGKEDQGLSFLFGPRFSLGIVNNWSSACICVSRALATHYGLRVEHSRLRVIHPSMHSVHPHPTPSDSFNIFSSRRSFNCVLIGALIEGKGQEEAIFAFAHLKANRIDAQLLIAGEGPPQYRRRLEQLVRSCGLDERVRLIGQVSDALPLMKSSDAVLVCSRREAFGRVTIEAMIAGKPVIGARSGATAELIRDGFNGMLYEQGNPADLAAKIEYLYRNPAIAAQMVMNAQTRVRTYFTRERYARDLMSVLNSLCEPVSKAVTPASAT